jgi:transposase
MRRSEALQGARMLRFRDILGRYESNEINQIEAAELPGVSERTFRRWCQRFEDGGEAGLLDRRLGKVSGKRVPPDREQEVETLYRTRYSGLTARHFHEHLVRDHRFNRGYTWTKTFLQSKGLVEHAKRRGAHRRKRPRRPLPGMMLHQDGSRHEWLAGQDAMDLIMTHARSLTPCSAPSRTLRAAMRGPYGPSSTALSRGVRSPDRSAPGTGPGFNRGR